MPSRQINDLLQKRKIEFVTRPDACQCTVTSYDTSGCGEDCINRMTYTECDSRTCPAGDKCTNNQIQKHKFTHGLERFMTDSKGWGVKTKQPVGAGQFIMEYVGEVGETQNSLGLWERKFYMIHIHF